MNGRFSAGSSRQHHSPQRTIGRHPAFADQRTNPSITRATRTCKIAGRHMLKEN